MLIAYMPNLNDSVISPFAKLKQTLLIDAAIGCKTLSLDDIADVGKFLVKLLTCNKNSFDLAPLVKRSDDDIDAPYRTTSVSSH